MTKVMEKTPSVEKIFAAVTTEIKPNTTGKYFVQIDDNWRMQSIRERFATLEDAVKIARIIHSELRKVSRLIYATVEARTVDINKYYFRADHWTTFFEIDDYGKEKIKRRETVEVIAELDNRTVEEVQNDICSYGYDYGVYTNSAEVEEVKADNAPKLTKFEVGKWYYDLFDSDKKPAYKVVKRTKKMLTLVDDFGEIIKKKISVDLGVEEIHIGGVNSLDETALKATAFCVNSDEIQKAEDDLSYSIAQDTAAEVEEVNAPAKNNPLQEKIAGLRTTEKIIAEKYLNLCRSLYVKIDGEYHSAVGFDDYVTKFHDTFYCKEGNNYVEDTAAYGELKAIECEWNAIFKELEYFEKIEDKADILKAKIAEQKKSRKPIIDWKATFEDMRISEILNLQKDFKKFLKLGEVDLAENVFSMLKTLCRNYRTAA